MDDNSQAGFIKLIIFIVLAVLFLQFFDLKVSDIVDWFKSVL